LFELLRFWFSCACRKLRNDSNHFPQEASIFPEVDAQHLRDGEDVLAMGDRGEDVIGYPSPELENALLMTGGAEVPPLTRECQQILLPTRIAPDPSKPLREVTAREELLDDAPDDRPVKAALLLVPGRIGRFELGEVLLRALVEG